MFPDVMHIFLRRNTAISAKVTKLERWFFPIQEALLRGFRNTVSLMWTLQMQVRVRPKVSEKHTWLYDTIHKAEMLSVHL